MSWRYLLITLAVFLAAETDAEIQEALGRIS